MTDSVNRHDLHVKNIEFSLFVEGKLRWWFDMLDVNKDSLLSKADLKLVADRFCKEHALDENQAIAIGELLTDGWCKVLETGKEGESGEELRRQIPCIIKMGQELKDGIEITQDAFIEAYGQLINYSPRLAKTILERTVTAFFDVFDYDKDNCISREEMNVAMRCLGLDEGAVVDMAFSCLDLDKDDKLSRREYIDGWLNFLLGQDTNHPFVVAFTTHITQP